MQNKVDYHEPVLKEAAIAGLNIKPNGTYVDLTFGGGGHSKAILSALNQDGKLIAFDKDADASANAATFADDERFALVPYDFCHLRAFLAYFGLSGVDGILADLGVSSHQFDVGSRGFAYRFDGPLDMRMDQTNPLSAATIVNTWPIEDLKKIFFRYSDLKNAAKIAAAIDRFRNDQSIDSTATLKEIIAPLARPAHKKDKFYAQVFQALRIAVNNELGSLEQFLTDLPEMLNPQGRAVIISYHSKEDKLVKNLIQSGNINGKRPEADIYGHFSLPLQNISRKAIKADAEEIAKNPRARSARMRIAEK